MKISISHRVGSHIKWKPHNIIINFSLYGDVIEVLKCKNLLPKSAFVTEDFLGIWVKQYSKLRPIVTLANTMDEYKCIASLETNLF